MHTAVAAVTSINPSIVARQTTGVDSSELQEVQARLLDTALRVAPGAMYPGAWDALADLYEIAAQDELERDGGREDEGERMRRGDKEGEGEGKGRKMGGRVTDYPPPIRHPCSTRLSPFMFRPPRCRGDA